MAILKIEFLTKIYFKLNYNLSTSFGVFFCSHSKQIFSRVKLLLNCEKVINDNL